MKCKFLLSMLAMSVIGTGQAYSQSSIEIEGITYTLQEDHAAVTTFKWQQTDFEILPEVTFETAEGNLTVPVTVIDLPKKSIDKVYHTLYIPSSIKWISSYSFYNTLVENLYIEDLTAWCNTEIETDFDWGNTFFMYKTYGSPISRETKLYFNNEPLGDVLTIPDGIKKLNPFIFKNVSCKKIVISDDVEFIGAGALYQDGVYSDNPSIIEEIDLGAGVVEIDQLAFRGCKNLKVLRLSDKLEKVGTWAFEWCNPAQIYCPSLSTWFGIEYDWRNTDQTIEGPQLSEEYDLYIGGEKITDVTVPSGVVLSDLCFAGANIEKVVFEEGVTNTGGWPFMDCSELEKVVLPSSLEYNGCSFLGCDSLREVWTYCPVPKVYYDYSTWPYESDSWMDSSWDNPGVVHATLYVPEEYVENYKVAKGWSKFKEILPIMTTGVESLDTESDATRQIYDLNGRKVTGEPAKGIYIINGKKIAVH